MIADKNVKLGRHTPKKFKVADVAVGRIAVVGWYDAEPERGVIVEWNRSAGGAVLIVGRNPRVEKFDGADQIIELEGFITKI